ncbi:MAG: hypothetical protein LUC91_08150, partial [Prevotella sp.]|nr:hypothetical protein [Prevotella sp.]
MRKLLTVVLLLAIISANITFAQEMSRMSELVWNETGASSEDDTQTNSTISSINGHEYVDLGLSVKWATCNLGATSPSRSGNYFAWGEISTKLEYTEDNSVIDGTSMGDIAGNPRYDAARSNWGGTWRLPTNREIDELVQKCSKVWTTQDGVNGYKITGPNGNSIFLPAAGYCFESSSKSQGICGYYWSSTPNGKGGAFYLEFGSNYLYKDSHGIE